MTQQQKKLKYGDLAEGFGHFWQFDFQKHNCVHATIGHN